MRVRKTGKISVKSALQREKVLALRITGKSMREIGAEMKISGTRVYQIIVAAIDELRANNTESAEHVRRLELERLDAMTVQLWGQRDNARSADTLLRIMERRAKLLGIDSPTKFSGPNGEPLMPPPLIVSFTNDPATTEPENSASV